MPLRDVARQALLETRGCFGISKAVIGPIIYSCRLCLVLHTLPFPACCFLSTLCFIAVAVVVIDFFRNSSSNKVASWLKLPWEGSGVVRCRHTMSIMGSFGVVIWGGYDGDTVVNDEVKVWHASLHDHVGPVEGFIPLWPKSPLLFARNTRFELRSLLFLLFQSNLQELQQMAKQKTTKEKQLQERWKAEVPVRESDLPAEVLAKAKRSKFPGAIFKAVHRYATSIGRDTYIDPASGYSVFTQLYLKRFIPIFWLALFAIAL
jgi:hypothetical protein